MAVVYTLFFVLLSLFKASTHLIWSVFGLTNLEKMESHDELSTAVVGVLYVMFLILSVIMLVNMLVALLTNTYNKVEVRIYSFSFLIAELIVCLTIESLRCGSTHPSDSIVRQTINSAIISNQDDEHL